MGATERWVKKHGYRDDPARREVIDDIVKWLDEDFALAYVSCWDWVVTPTPEKPMPVAIRLECAHTTEWVLDGLFPPECDRLGYHLPWDGRDTHVGREQLVVATLATLLYRRGTELDERTVSYLHGRQAIFDGYRMLPPPDRIWLCDRVEQRGWDETVKFLEKKQQELQYLANGRRGRGRPKNEEFESWTRDRFEALQNLAQVAEKAAERFDIKPEAAKKRIERSSWFKSMAPAITLPKQEPSAPPARPAAGADSMIQVSVTVNYLRAHGPRTTEEVAKILGVAERNAKQLLRKHPDKFRYLLGERWEAI
jgi:hypothetical protein